MSPCGTERANERLGFARQGGEQLFVDGDAGAGDFHPAGRLRKRR